MYVCWGHIRWVPRALWLSALTASWQHHWFFIFLSFFFSFSFLVFFYSHCSLLLLPILLLRFAFACLFRFPLPSAPEPALLATDKHVHAKRHDLHRGMRISYMAIYIHTYIYTLYRIYVSMCVCVRVVVVCHFSAAAVACHSARHAAGTGSKKLTTISF